MNLENFKPANLFNSIAELQVTNLGCCRHHGRLPDAVPETAEIVASERRMELDALE